MGVNTGVDPTVKPLKVLYYDIETAPMISYLWNPKVDYVSPQMNISKYYLLCWAAKWEDGKGVYSDYLTSEETHAADDDRIVLSMADLLRKADIAIAHNGDRFDLKKVNWRVALHKQEPLGPIQTVDTLKLSRASFGTEYHNLDELAKELTGDGKIKVEWELWERAKNGDPVAMRKLVKYCRRDVVKLEETFQEMKPYVNKLPRMVDGSGIICPYCGSGHYQKRGTRYHRTNAYNYQRFQCQRCSRYFRLKKAEPQSLETRPI